MELHVKNLLESDANLEDIYPIYKALKSTNLINTHNIVKDSSDRDIFYYLMDNIKRYQYSDEYLPFVMDYLENKDKSVFMKNRPGYYPLEKIGSDFKNLKEDVLLSLFEIILQKITINELINFIPNEYGYHDTLNEDEQFNSKTNQIISSAYGSGKFKLLNFLKEKGLNVSDNYFIKVCINNEESLKYFIDNHKNLQEIMSYDNEEMPIWKVLMDKSPVSYLPIIEEWCSQNINDNVLKFEKINKLKSSLKNFHSKTCEKLKTIDGWENMNDENDYSIVRYVMNIDPSHANKITLKKSLNALNQKDNKGQNAWLDVLININKLHTDAIVFIKDNVDLTLNNKNEGIFEQLLKESSNSEYNMPSLNAYDSKDIIKNKMKIIGKRDPNIILGNSDFLENLLYGKEKDYYETVFPKLIYYFINNLKPSKIEEINNKEWLGFGVLMSLIENKTPLESDFINNLLEKGAVLPKSIDSEIIKEVFSDPNLEDILINLKKNKSISEKNILINGLKDENENNLSIKKRM